jgi:hypothetical protein
LREVNRERVSEGLHPIDRHYLHYTPGTERPSIQFAGESHKPQRLSVHVTAQFSGITKLLVSKHGYGPDVSERSAQLIMMSIAPRQTVIVY